MDTDNNGWSDSQTYFSVGAISLFERFWVLRDDQAIEPIVYYYHIGYIFITNLMKKWIIRISQELHRKHFKTSNGLTFRVNMKPIFVFQHLADSLKCWYLLRYFSDNLAACLFDYCFQVLVANCKWTSFTTLIFKNRISTVERQKSHALLMSEEV